jgi:hypothetical protein
MTEFVVQDADGQEIMRAAAQLHATQPPPDLPTGWDMPIVVALNIELFPPKFGHYSIEITIDGDHKKSLPFRVTEVKAAPGTPPGGLPGLPGGPSLG